MKGKGVHASLMISLGIVVMFLMMLQSCKEVALPKPRAYYRINFPEKRYITFNEGCPYSFEYPEYARMIPDMEGDEQYCWMNLNFKDFNADLHISYKPIVEEDDFQHLLNDAYTFVNSHNVKAEKITEERISNSAVDAHGLLFKIGGNTASNLQFFLTDSTEHFFRASLYFNSEPNKDSLAPVIDFISQDIDYLISGFRWTDVELEKFR